MSNQNEKQVQAPVATPPPVPPSILDTYEPGEFTATINHKSGARVYKTAANELFCVVVLTTDEYKRATLLCEESKENGSPMTFGDAVEKSVADGIKANLRSVEYTLNNKRNKLYKDTVETLKARYLSEPGSKTWHPEEFAKRDGELRRKLKIGNTQVDMT